MPTSIKDECAIVGIGQTEFSENSGRSELQLTVECVKTAIEDAGLALSDIDIVEKGNVEPALDRRLVDDDHLQLLEVGLRQNVVVGVDLEDTVEAGHTDDRALWTAVAVSRRGSRTLRPDRCGDQRHGLQQAHEFFQVGRSQNGRFGHGAPEAAGITESLCFHSLPSRVGGPAVLGQ